MDHMLLQCFYNQDRLRWTAVVIEALQLKWHYPSEILFIWHHVRLNALKGNHKRVPSVEILGTLTEYLPVCQPVLGVRQIQLHRQWSCVWTVSAIMLDWMLSDIRYLEIRWYYFNFIFACALKQCINCHWTLFYGNVMYCVS